MGKLRGKLTYSRVVSTLALFLALGLGTAWAATELEKNEVKSKHLKNGGVKTKDLADDAVTSPKVADGSLLDDDFAPGQLPQGPQGEQGPPGPPGSDAQFNGARAGNALTGTYPDPGLAPSESVHVVGAPGEPPFAGSATNSAPNNFVPAGFYVDRYGVVHLQGTVNGANGTLFTLPAGYRPSLSTCFAAPAFVNSNTFTANRVCVNKNGNVSNERGDGNTFLSLDGITFRVG